MNHNPYLRADTQRENIAGKGQIEIPGQAPNIVWQHRAAEPTAYENALGDALERVFADGAETLDEVVAALNALNQHDADGRPWTTASFEATLARLGA